MFKRSCTYGIAVLASVVLLGCVSQTRTPGGDGKFVYPDEWKFAHNATTQTCDNTRNCEVNVLNECVTVQFPTPQQICRKWVNIDETHLQNGKQNIKIVWHLQDGYYFCVSDGDGVFLKGGNDGQFGDMYSTEKGDGNESAERDCKKHKNFHWKALNSKPGKGYEYVMKFHGSDGNPQQIVIDPWIYNN